MWQADAAERAAGPVAKWPGYAAQNPIPRGFVFPLVTARLQTGGGAIRAAISTAMSIVDFILNLAGLLLWLNWRSNRIELMVKRTPATLMGTLRPAAPKKHQRWHLLFFILVLLLLRALIYWMMGLERSGKLNLGLVVLWFPTHSHWGGHWSGRWADYCHMTLYSFLSFGVILGVFYVWLLGLSLLAGPLPIHGLVTIPLGRVDRWPRWVRAVLPFFATAVFWWLTSWWLCCLQMLPPISAAGRFQQGILLGLSSYLQWQYPLGAILGLHLLNSYIYFGQHPIWRYISATAQTILHPLRFIPLRVGRVDFAPVVGIGLIFLAAHSAEFGIKSRPRMATNGQHLPPSINLPGLVDMYAKIPR